jgi:hypothetical protein
MIATKDFTGDPARIDAKAVLDAVGKGQEGVTINEIMQDGYPGIEFQREDKDKGTTMLRHHRVVVANGRMFQQIVMVEKGKAKSADAEKFFNSFQILKKPAAKDD